MNPFSQLQRFTPARVALGRVGVSLPTAALLDFELAHAQARDAVHASFRPDRIERDVQALGWGCLRAHSAAQNREEYLRRPDLGRRLASGQQYPLSTSQPELLFIIADGLSALAAERHAVPLLASLQPRLQDWCVGPVILAEQARVALGDEVGQIFGAELAVVLIGERPGLSAPDSLGVYVTYAPQVGRSDAQRNCISNIHCRGLSYEVAAHRLAFLLTSARRLRLTGTSLKDQSNGELPALLQPNVLAKSEP